MASLFLSHSSKDKFFVRELASKLIDAGVTVWLDEAEISVGDSLTDKIGKAIDKTDFVGVVLSHNSVASEWVQRELQIAIQKELSKKKIVILPILLEAVEIPPFLRDKLYANFTNPDKYDEGIPKLLKAMNISPEKKEITPNEKQLPPVQTKAVKQLIEFDDIHIVGLDDKLTYNPDSQKALYNIYLTLSVNPAIEWGQIFEAERKFPRYMMWRRAWIEGKHIVIYCGLDELEKYHINELKQDVANANSKYRNYLLSLAREQDAEQQKQQSEKDKLLNIKNRLRFD